MEGWSCSPPGCFTKLFRLACLATCEEERFFIRGRGRVGTHGAHFLIEREFLRRFGLWGIDELAAAWGADQGVPVSVCLAVGMAVTVAITCDNLEIGKHCFGNAPGISLVDQLLDLFRYQFVSLDQSLGNRNQSLAVLLKQAFDRLELRLKYGLDAVSQFWQCCYTCTAADKGYVRSQRAIHTIHTNIPGGKLCRAGKIGGDAV